MRLRIQFCIVVLFNCGSASTRPPSSRDCPSLPLVESPQFVPASYLTRAPIDRAFKRHVPRFRCCYQTINGASSEQQIVVEVKMAENGFVRSAQIPDSYAPFERCLQRSLDGFEILSPMPSDIADEDEYTIRYPLLFKPK